LSGHSAQPLDFSNLRIFLELNPDNVLAVVGVILVLCGVAFKIGAFPFQIWIPDVYQGAPTPVAAFLAIASKAAGFGLLLRLVTYVFPPLYGFLIPGLISITALTILFGNLSALTQRNTKRLMGLSGIAHAGFLLLGVTAATSVKWASGAVVFYLFAYMLASIAVFAVMTHLSLENDTGLEINQFMGIGKKSPLLASVLTVGLGSLAGIPPLGGFVGKVLIFVAAFKAGLYSLLVVAILGVILSIYYYFGWIKMALFQFQKIAPDGQETDLLEVRPVSFFSRVAFVCLAFASIALGFYQGPVSQLLPF
jgi:NADH-quinone oxidoreductase subunit N